MILKIGTLKDWKIAIRTRRSTERRFAKKIDERRAVRILRETRQVISYRRLKAPSGSQRGVRLSFPAAELQSLAFPISLALIK